MAVKITIRGKSDTDLPWIQKTLTDYWETPKVVSRGNIIRADQIPAFIALIDNQPTGLITYRFHNGECEIVSLSTNRENMGIGTKLISTVLEAAKLQKAHRVWLITLNDNVDALRFYQKRGFHLAALYPGAVAASRQMKPQIPQIGKYAIPLRDEIELEYLLS